MKDRFKFRVFHTPTNSMCDVVCLNCLSQNEIVIANYKKTNGCAIVSWGECTILQCTGLKDKNGKLIYEGDIVAILSEIDTYAKIEWSDDLARFIIVYENIQADFDNYFGYELEIIGNIYENPELLEEVQE